MTGTSVKRMSVLLVAIALALFGLAACGDDDDDGDATTAAEETTATEPADGGGGGATIDISAAADGTLAYDQTDIQTTAGSDTLNFDNPASLSHDVVIEDESGGEVGRTDLISQSSTSTTVELTPGTYTFYCSVPGHREGGMEGTLTAK
jgi:plastocyanin